MFRVIAAERKRREIDPTLLMLRQCVAEADESPSKGNACAKKRLGDLLGFFERVSNFYDTMNRLPTQRAVKSLNMGDRLLKFLGKTI